MDDHCEPRATQSSFNNSRAHPNAIVLWNTRYMGLTLDELRTAGMLIQPEDVERLSPLVHHHIHLDGRYSFSLPEPLVRGELRPLRDPHDPAEQVFDLVGATA